MIILLFSEFGRRVHDNGSGTDHGAAGPAFVLGEKVKGGHYGEYPSLKAEDLVQGDLNPNMDFRGVYSTILEKWLKLDPKPIVGGTLRATGLPELDDGRDARLPVDRSQGGGLHSGADDMTVFRDQGEGLLMGWGRLWH